MSRQLTRGQREYTELMGSSPEEGLAGVRLRLLTADQPKLRIGLMASDLIGLMMARYIIGAEPLASLSPDAVVAYIAPVLQHHLAGPIPAEHQLPPSRTSLGGARRQAGAGPNAKEGAKR